MLATLSPHRRCRRSALLASGPRFGRRDKQALVGVQRRRSGGGLPGLVPGEMGPRHDSQNRWLPTIFGRPGAGAPGRRRSNGNSRSATSSPLCPLVPRAVLGASGPTAETHTPIERPVVLGCSLGSSLLLQPPGVCHGGSRNSSGATDTYPHGAGAVCSGGLEDLSEGADGPLLLRPEHSIGSDDCSNDSICSDEALLFNQGRAHLNIEEGCELRVCGDLAL